MADYIQIGDRVKFRQNNDETQTTRGVVESLTENIMMIKIDDGDRKFLWGALKTGEKWLAFCQYSRKYTEEVSKE